MTASIPTPSPFELADAQHWGCVAVAVFIDAQVRPHVEAEMTRNPAVAHIWGLLLRATAWLRTVAKLNEPGDFQAAAAGARSMFEISLDLSLLHFDPKGHPINKLVAWENSLKHHHATQVADYLETQPKGAHPEMAAPIAWSKQWAKAVQADRERYWPSKKGKAAAHPPRWTGHPLDHDVKVADGLSQRGFTDWYQTRYRPSCWNTHGSGLAGIAGIDEQLFPGLTAFAFTEIGDWAIVAAEMAVRLAGTPADEASRLSADLSEARQSAVVQKYRMRVEAQQAQANPQPTE